MSMFAQPSSTYSRVKSSAAYARLCWKLVSINREDYPVIPGCGAAAAQHSLRRRCSNAEGKFPILWDATITWTLTSKKRQNIFSSAQNFSSSQALCSISFVAISQLHLWLLFKVLKSFAVAAQLHAVVISRVRPEWVKSIHPWSTSITPSIASKMNSKVSMSRIEADLNRLCKRGTKRPSWWAVCSAFAFRLSPKPKLPSVGIAFWLTRWRDKNGPVFGCVFLVVLQKARGQTRWWSAGLKVWALCYISRSFVLFSVLSPLEGNRSSRAECYLLHTRLLIWQCSNFPVATESAGVKISLCPKKVFFFRRLTGNHGS